MFLPAAQCGLFFAVWGSDDFPQKRIAAQEFIDQVRGQGGFCVACHPFRSNNRGLAEHLLDVGGLHGVEVLNGSTSREAPTFRLWPAAVNRA